MVEIGYFKNYFIVVDWVDWGLVMIVMESVSGYLKIFQVVFDIQFGFGDIGYQVMVEFSVLLGYQFGLNEGGVIIGQGWIFILKF